MITNAANTVDSQVLGNARQDKTLHPDEKYTERVQKLRVDFWAKIRDIPVQDLVFFG